MYMASGVPETLWAACELPRSVGQTALRLDMASSKLNPHLGPRPATACPQSVGGVGAARCRSQTHAAWIILAIVARARCQFIRWCSFHIGQLPHAHPQCGSMAHGVMKGRCRRPRGSRSANISRSTVRACFGQRKVATSCWARVGDGVDGAFERVMTIRTWMMSVDGGIGRRLWCVGAGPIVSWKWLSPP